MNRISAADKVAIDRAVQAGLQPRATGKSTGLIVTVQGTAGRKATYRSLISTNGTPTAAGQYYFRRLNEEPPNRNFDPTQTAVRAPRGKSDQGNDASV